MQTIKINTFQNIQVEYPIGGLGERILAKLIDLFISTFPMVLFLIIFANYGKRSSMALGIIIIFFVLFYLFYSLIFPVFMTGQTPGKSFMKLKIISLEGTSTSFIQYFLRWIFSIIDYIFYLGLIIMATNNKSQRVADMVAGTAIISIKEIVQNDFFVGINYPENYEPKFPEAYQLSDRDISILKDLINKFHSSESINSSIMEKASEKIKSILNIQSYMPDQNFIEQIIKDYNYHFQKLA